MFLKVFRNDKYFLPKKALCFFNWTFFSQGNIYGDPVRDRRLEWTEEDFARMDRAFDKIGVPLRIGMSQEEFKGFMMEGKA